MGHHLHGEIRLPHVVMGKRYKPIEWSPAQEEVAVMEHENGIEIWVVKPEQRIFVIMKDMVQKISRQRILCKPLCKEVDKGQKIHVLSSELSINRMGSYSFFFIFLMTTVPEAFVSSMYSEDSEMDGSKEKTVSIKMIISPLLGTIAIGLSMVQELTYVLFPKDLFLLHIIRGLSGNIYNLGIFESRNGLSLLQSPEKLPKRFKK